MSILILPMRTKEGSPARTLLVRNKLKHLVCYAIQTNHLNLQPVGVRRSKVDDGAVLLDHHS